MHDYWLLVAVLIIYRDVHIYILHDPDVTLAGNEIGESPVLSNNLESDDDDDDYAYTYRISEK